MLRGPQLFPWSWHPWRHARFFSSCLSSLSAIRWSAVHNVTSPVMDQTSSMLVCCKLRHFSSVDVTVFWRPRLYLLTGIVLRVPMRGVRDLDFPKKSEAKRFTKVASIHLWTHLPYFSWCVVKRSTTIGSHLPMRRNFPGDIPRCFSDLGYVPLPCLLTYF